MSEDPTGWMPGVGVVRALGFGYPDVKPDGMYPQITINHIASGYWDGLMSIARQLSPNKSWHFSVARDGRFVQHCSVWNPAWHAGDVKNPTSPWIARYGPNPNRYSIGIECEGFSQADPGWDYVYDAAHPWPQPMVDSIIRIHRFVWERCQWLQDATDKAARVTGHYEFNTITRSNDPGAQWLAQVKPQIIAAIDPPPFVAPALLPPNSDEYNRGWNDYHAAALAALEAIRKRGP